MIHRRAKSRFVPHDPEAVRTQFKKIAVRAHARADGVTKVSATKRERIRVCPVCVKPIGRNDRVSGHGANLMHETCDHANDRQSPTPSRLLTSSRWAPRERVG